MATQWNLKMQSEKLGLSKILLCIDIYQTRFLRLKKMKTKHITKKGRLMEKNRIMAGNFSRQSNSSTLHHHLILYLKHKQSLIVISKFGVISQVSAPISVHKQKEDLSRRGVSNE